MKRPLRNARPDGGTKLWRRRIHGVRGFPRKAQYRIFTGYLVAFLGAFGGLLLLAISYLDPTAFSVIRSAASDVTAPVSRLFTSARVGGQQGGNQISAYFNAASKNAALKAELERSRTQLIEARALEQENTRLKGLLGLIDEQGKPVAIARLISGSASSTRRYAILGAGRNQGVAPGQPVRAQNGLIGRIFDVGANVSRVLLVTDADNVVPVKRAIDGMVAFAQGRGDGSVDIRLINIGINDLKAGDVFVTSGNGGLYSPNIPVAIVDKRTSDGARARILSSPSSSDFVIVQPVYQPEIAQEGAALAKPNDGMADKAGETEAEAASDIRP